MRVFWPMALFLPIRPFGTNQFGPPGLSPQKNGTCAPGQFSLADVSPGPGVCPGRCLVNSGRASVVHHPSTGPHKVAGGNEFLSEFRRVGARESWTRGCCNVGPPLALGLRGTTCPRPVCGLLGPSGGPMPLRFCGAMPGRVGIGLPAVTYLRPPRFRGRLGMVPIFGNSGRLSAGGAVWR